MKFVLGLIAVSSFAAFAAPVSISPPATPLQKKISASARASLLLQGVFVEQGLDQVSSAAVYKFLSGLPNVKTPADLKLAIEARLKSLNHDQPLKYNKDSVRVSDPVLTGRLQCASGTLLFLLAAQRTKFAGSAVAIFSSGHIRPGVMIKGKDGYRLEGIETTVDGRGVVDYGPTSQFPTNELVVSADDFLVSKALKGALKDPAGFRATAIQRAIKRFGLPSPEMSKEVAGDGHIDPNDTAEMANASIFAFGRSNVPSGDVERSTADAVPVGGLVLNPYGQKVDSRNGQVLPRQLPFQPNPVYPSMDNERTPYPGPNSPVCDFGDTKKRYVPVQVGDQWTCVNIEELGI